MLELDRIRIDGETQSRVEVNKEVVAEYAEAYKAGAKFPPVVVFYDGVDRWLADGFHRYFGAKAAGVQQIYEEIIPGTQRDAVLYSLKANATHGLKRTSADKRKAVETLLKDAEWASWSDRKIAEVCGVGNQLVGDVRRAICVIHTDEPEARTVERNGKTYTQDTSNIGKAKVAAPESIATAPATTPAPAPVFEDTPSAEESPAPDYTELDRAHDQITDLQAALALANLGEVSDEDRQQAAELISGLQAEVKGLTAHLRAVTSSRDFLMQENAQMKAQMASQRKEIERLKASATA